MSKALTMLALAALTVAAAVPAEAQVVKGSVRISWDNCDPIVVNKDFTGPGQVARLIGSVTNVNDPHRGYRIRVGIRGGSTPLGDAWRFDATQCNAGQASLNTAGLSKTCAAFQGGAPVPVLLYGYEVPGDNEPNSATLDVLNAYNSVLGPFNPADRLTLFQVSFDHAFSATGPRDPAVACGYAERSLCISMRGTEWLNPDLSSDQFGIENEQLGWNNADPVTNCTSVQLEATTWGRVKGLYR